ncbi:MAG: N-acetyltransferase family protein [Novosphingobium sp.]
MTAIDQTIVHTRLEDGRRICIRAVTPDDEPRMRAGIDALSAQSRYLRFFSPAPRPPERVITQLVAVDGHRHLAWGAILSDDPQHVAIGAVHAVRSDETAGFAEFAVGVLDAFHGLGLARMLSCVLLIHCRAEGITTLDVQILSENRAAARLVRSLGASRVTTAQGVSDYQLDTSAALDLLRDETSPKGLRDVFAAFGSFL